MKQYMMLDDKLPARHSIPIHPETGEPWRERYEEIIEISCEIATGNPLAALKRAELIAITTFREEPYMVELIPPLKPVGDDSRVFSCNPATWEEMPQCGKDRFILVETLPGSEPESRLILPDRFPDAPSRPDLN